MNETLAIRIDAENPYHHLWQGGDTWWIHYTVHYETEAGAARKRRVRYSLGTPVLDRARVLRDAIFAAWTEPPELFPDARIEVADHEGLTLRCAAPDPANARRLTRIDRGMNMVGTLVDDFYVAIDRPWDPTSCSRTHAARPWTTLPGERPRRTYCTRGSSTPHRPTRTTSSTTTSRAATCSTHRPCATCSSAPAATSRSTWPA